MWFRFMIRRGAVYKKKANSHWSLAAGVAALPEAGRQIKRPEKEDHTAAHRDGTHAHIGTN